MYRLLSMTAVCCALAAPALAQTESERPNRERSEAKAIPDRAERPERAERPRFEARREANRRRQAMEENRAGANPQRRARQSGESGRSNGAVRPDEASRRNTVEQDRRRGAPRDADRPVQPRRDRPNREQRFRERRPTNQDVGPRTRGDAQRDSRQRQRRNLERDRGAPDFAPMQRRFRAGERPRGQGRQSRRFQGRRFQRPNAHLQRPPMRGDRLEMHRRGGPERLRSDRPAQSQRRQRPLD